MSASADLEWLREQPLVEALWWFIENGAAYDSSSDMFFMLRERYRLEHQTQ